MSENTPDLHLFDKAELIVEAVNALAPGSTATLVCPLGDELALELAERSCRNWLRIGEKDRPAQVLDALWPLTEASTDHHTLLVNRSWINLMRIQWVLDGLTLAQPRYEDGGPLSVSLVVVAADPPESHDYLLAAVAPLLTEQGQRLVTLDPLNR